MRNSTLLNPFTKPNPLSIPFDNPFSKPKPNPLSIPFDNPFSKPKPSDFSLENNKPSPTPNFQYEKSQALKDFESQQKIKKRLEKDRALNSNLTPKTSKSLIKPIIITVSIIVLIGIIYYKFKNKGKNKSKIN